jgi:NAD(P)-dependent dehydrogenase (short-subunit alcohol dehydrogenase family)
MSTEAAASNLVGSSRMRILIFGATGGTGRELVTQALEQGHEVTAFIRSPAKLTLQDARLRVGIRAGVGETRGQLAMGMSSNCNRRRSCRGLAVEKEPSYETAAS